MTGAVVRESVTLAGLAGRVRVARSFVDGVLGRGCRGAAGELFGNSVRHCGSGLPGQTVTVGEGLVRVEVTDRGGPGVPRGCRGCSRSAVTQRVFRTFTPKNGELSTVDVPIRIQID